MAILAQQYPVFKPAMRIITAITNDYPASITTSFAHGYPTGIIVRVIVPLGYGMEEINEKFGSIIVTGDTTFSIDIDTRYFNVFASPVSPSQYAQSVPIAEINSTVYHAYTNVLPYS